MWKAFGRIGFPLSIRRFGNMFCFVSPGFVRAGARGNLTQGKAGNQLMALRFCKGFALQADSWERVVALAGEFPYHDSSCVAKRKFKGNSNQETTKHCSLSTMFSFKNKTEKIDIMFLKQSKTIVVACPRSPTTFEVR